MAQREATGTTPDGVLAVWKPTGWTSHDVVARARRLLGVRRIGHTGTLDPAVTGVLPLCVGRATRLVEYLQEMTKEYTATLRFGIATDTEDATGQVVEEKDASHLTADEMRSAALSFVGDIEQVPPMMSAVKMNGKRLYELARQGVTIERPARPVTIERMDVLSATAGVPHPELRFVVRCSKGTYIRTLCVDIGRKLGVPALRAELVRSESAGLTRDDCVTLEQLEQLAGEGQAAKALLPADRLLAGMPRAEVGDADAVAALQGRALRAERLSPRPPENAGLMRLYRVDGAFLGLFRIEHDSGAVRPVKVFHPQEEQEP